jgi:signal peptidase I
MPSGINSMTPFNRQRLCWLLVSLQLIGCAALSGRTVTFEGTSMLPTIKNGEKLVTEKLDARSTGKLKTGDIIVFKYPKDPSKGYIKRLIGLPGDTVEIRGEEVWVNGGKLPEPYVDSRMNLAHRSLPAVVVPSHSYYVLGDNRDDSSDSRIWGCVPEEMLISRVVR